MRLLCLLLLCPLLALAEPATVIRATELKKEPAADAATLAELPENAALEALERKGGWTRVKSASGEGWVRMLALRFGAAGAARAGGDSGIAQLFNAARTGSSGTQVTTGVRGLDEAMLANAQPNKAELEKMSQFAATPEAAAGFAAQGRLGAHPVEEVK
jgi:hypothetical protein